MSENPTFKAYIIDDVPEAIAALSADIEAYCPSIEIIATANSVVSGAKLLRESQPDILFLDVHLTDGTGFDILEIVGELTAKVIFTTGSNEFAIKAFRFSAMDYLLKPVDPDELMAAVQKVKEATFNNENIDLLQQNMQATDGPKKIALHTQEKIQVVEIDNIIRCESTGNYTIFYFTDNKKLLVTKTLKEYDKLFASLGFLRIHQSHLINTAHIAEFVKTDGGYLLMKDGQKVAVSVRKKAVVMDYLENL